MIHVFDIRVSKNHHYLIYLNTNTYLVQVISILLCLYQIVLLYNKKDNYLNYIEAIIHVSKTDYFSLLLKINNRIYFQYYFHCYINF